MSPEQEQYVAYHSPEQRASRSEAQRIASEAAVSDAHRLFFSGDAEAAQYRLESAGLQFEGISYYLNLWGSDQ
jgi:hypothetical protein